MTFGHYWSVVQKHWRLILACFLVTGLVTFAVSKIMKPVYQSTVLVQVAIQSTSSSNQSDYTNLLASDQLVQTEAQLAVSDPVLREVAGHYTGLTVEQLTKQVTATTKTNTQLLEIDVQNSNPAQAATLANDIATTLIKQQVQVAQQSNSKSQQQIQQQLDKNQQQINSLTQQITALQGQANKQAQLTALQTQLIGLQQHNTEWETILAQLELDEAQSSGFLRVVQPAQPAIAPIRPLILLNTGAGFVSGLLLGLLLALLFEQLDTRIRTPESLLQLADWPLLATLRLAKTKDAGDIVNPQNDSTNIEAYRILRANVGFASVDKSLRTMLVTSAVLGEGKSTIAANLAIFMAKAGKSTLLIDADLRRPTLHEKFRLSGDKMGLSNAIMALAHFQAAAQPLIHPTNSFVGSQRMPLEPFMHSVGIPNLFVMPSGPLPPNPSELLDSKSMEHFFTAVTNCGAEIIIFDTPPLLGLSDTSILASKVDGVLYIVDITSANKGNLSRTKTILTQAGAKVLGCVVNKERRNSKDNSYYYYYTSADQIGAKMQNTGNGHMPSAPIASTSAMTPTQQWSQFN